MSAAQGNPAQISLNLEATPVLSYAMAHNEISVISRLVIDGVPTAARGAVLRLDVADATGPIGEPHEVLLDLQAATPTVLTDLRMVLDPSAMLQVEEQRPGVIRARLEIGGEVRAECSVRVRVLAAQQWLAAPPALALEMLAAHVLPNHPAITTLMREVADRLPDNPSLNGYQAGPERVDAIVGAVYAAVQARGIRYAEPPASWADLGQKIRTPGEVLDGRTGTCLDLVVVMAAALEQAGIRPLIWVVEGHAFLGYWREEASLGCAAQFDTADVVNRVDLGQIRLVETTAVTVGSEPVPFAGTHRPPYVRFLTGDLDRVLGVTDVHQARMDRIVPLPARTRDADGTVTVTVYAPPVSQPMPDRAAQGVTPRAARTEPARVTRWKNALLDLSLRNRLINFTARSALSLTVPDGRLGQLEDLLHQGAAITLRASDDVAAVDVERGTRAGRDLPQYRLADLLGATRTVYADVTDAAYATRLRGLAYKARTIREETGANNLYLALGSLVWELDGRALRSPLILVPVTLTVTARGGRYRLSLDEAGSSTPNYCLIEKLRQVHALEIPGLTDPVLDDAGIDLDAAFEATRTGIAEHGLRFRVEPTADLAVLQFAKFGLWRDLDENWATFAANPLVDHLMRTPTDAFGDPVPESPTHDLDGLDEACPVPADSSQLRAIAEAVAGRTFVLEGPPGTGKSQTITNLLTRAVADGKRVLFVAEKRAALDVVQRRLDAIGMGPLSLDLHDKGSKPTAVRDQIRRALDHTVAADVADHDVRLQELRAARRGLTRYAYRLHDGNAAGHSLYGARDTALAIGDAAVAMPIPDSLLTGSGLTGSGLTGSGLTGSGLTGAGPDTVARLRTLLSTLPDVADAARPRPGHPWAFIDDAARVDVTAASSAARRLDAALPGLPAAMRPALDAARVPDDLSVLAGLVGAGLSLHVLDETRTPRWNHAVEAILQEVGEFAGAAHPGLDLVTPEVLALPIPDIDAAARAAAGSGFFGRRRRLVAVRDRLATVLRPDTTVKPRRLTELTAALVALHDGVRDLVARISAIPGLAVAPGWTPFVDGGAFDARVAMLRWAGGVVDPAHPDPARARFAVPLRAVLDAGLHGDPAPVAEVAAAAQELVRACGVTPDAVAGWAGERGLLGTWRATATERATTDPQLGSLRRWLDLLAHLEPLRAEHLDVARAALLSGELDPDDARLSFDLGLAVASVAERLSSTGLDTFEAAAHDRGIGRFVHASRAVRDHLATMVPQQILRARGFDPASTGGQVGKLARQLGYKRGGMRVRELMTTFGEVITRALPCVLVSPDSLARFFPAGADLFDIVVFDEASQVRVADAIGAMGRARSVVVVGDSLQMPPTSFAESSFTTDDGDGDGTVEDEESILTECVQARVARHRLSWHYRSRDESLIAFSNHHYYDGALSSFPAPRAAGTGVSLVRVDGHFHRSGAGAALRTNPVEADAVVAEIRRRFAASPDAVPSLGVVTFNQPQRAYIEALLRDSGDPRLVDALEDDDGLFVKNLENVQGDERDVILFSTAFSVNARGVLPLNFGPLNRLGGERRLNVAVTRARRQVIVFSSFDPAQLRAEETSSIGLKHLRSYLEMAANGPSALPRAARRRDVPDRHREQIAEALRQRGLVVRTNVGLSGFTIDLTLADPATPDDPALAVLLDGPVWATRLTARDRDALPGEVLVDTLGWPAVERVWLPSWLADPGAVLDGLVAAVERAGQVEPPPPPVPLPGPAPAPPPDAAWPPAVEIFVPWAGKRLGSVEVLDALPEPSAAASVAASLVEVVAAEGPIQLERLARLVGNSFGLGRVVEVRRTAILRHLPPALRADTVEAVAWPPGTDPERWTGFRRAPADGARPVEEVPLREIVNAMAASAAAAAGMARTELQREVLGVFGGRRLTPGIAERLDVALALGVRTGRLRIDGDTVHAC